MIAEPEKTHRKPELLAPAGGMPALVAAVNNGADAVYLGLSEFNARRGAENFDVDALAEATRFAHLRGARVYLTANIVVLADELSSALAMVASAWNAGVDAVIVQDLGFASLVRTHLPEVRLHASTQLNTHNSATAAALVSLGVQRITLAREVSIPEIATLASRSPVEIESFVHGSLCYCYSGQCLMSSMIGRRSANRGLCAQPCRLPYRLVGGDGEADVPGKFLLSPRDLAGIAVLPRLIETGVAALKIEGRMKSPEYVALVTGVYRQALDRAWSDPERYEVLDAEWSVLEEAFSRGFTTAYLTGERRQALMSYSRPNNRGVLVGRVAEAEGRDASVALERAIESDDRIEVWTGRGRFAQPVGPMRVKDRDLSLAPAGERPRLHFERAVSSGDRVFRVANASLLRAARRTFEGRAAEEARPVAVDFRVRLRIGSPLRVELVADGVAVSAEGPVVEAARTRPVTVEDVMEHAGRLGGTPYEPRTWEIELDANAAVGFSVLHRVRREAVERLDEGLLAPWSGRSLRPPSLSPSRRSAKRPREVELVVGVSDLATAEACLRAGASRALLAVPALREPVVLPAGVEPLLPRIVHDDELPRVLEWAGDGGRVTAGNLGVLAAAVSRGACVGADSSLNVVNAASAAVVGQFGASLLWASLELSGRQLAELAATSPVPVGAVVFGRAELMVAEQCVLQAIGECGRRCATCARRRGRWDLADEKGYRFPVYTDEDGRSRIYNSVRLDLTKAMAEVLDSGVRAVRLDFHTDDVATAEATTRRFRRILDAHGAGLPLPEAPSSGPVTSGHFFRGVR